jgi:two-component system, response regulator
VKGKKLVDVNSILVVDDDPNSLMLLQCAFELEAPDTRVVYVQSGKEALEYLECRGAAEEGEGLPRLMLLDLKMPRMDGFQVLERLGGERSVRPGCVVVFTTSDDEGDRARAAELGADCYVVKPMQFTELCALARKLSVYVRTGSWVGRGLE